MNKSGFPLLLNFHMCRKRQSMEGHTYILKLNLAQLLP